MADLDVQEALVDLLKSQIDATKSTGDAIASQARATSGLTSEVKVSTEVSRRAATALEHVEPLLRELSADRADRHATDVRAAYDKGVRDGAKQATADARDSAAVAVEGALAAWVRSPGGKVALRALFALAVLAMASLLLPTVAPALLSLAGMPGVR